MSNTPRYVGFLDPPYNVTLTDDSGNALDLTGCTSSSFTLTMINLNTGLSQQCIGTWTVANQTTSKGQASYQWLLNDMATAGLWWLYTTVKLPGEPSPREFDPELIEIKAGTVGAGAAPPGVLPAPIAKALFFNATDYGTIQGALSAANSAGGGIAYVESNFTISAPLVIYSNTTLLVASGVVITLAANSNCHALQNYAVQANRRILDGVTNSTTTFTSASAAFVSGDVIAHVRLYYQDGTYLDTTIASVTNGTTAVLANAATFSQAGLYASIGAGRDSNIKVTGGLWVRLNPNGSGYTSNNLHFRHVDGLEVGNISGSTATSSGKYLIAPGDCTRFYIHDITPSSTTSDTVHINGPASFGTVERVSNPAPGDDIMAMTCGDYVADADVMGNITDISIRDIMVPVVPTSSPRTVLVLAGQSTTGTPYLIDRISIRDIYSKINQNTVLIANDTGDAFTTGGTWGRILIDGVVNSNPTTTASIVNIGGCFPSNVEVRALQATNTSITNYLTVQANAGVTRLTTDTDRRRVSFIGGSKVLSYISKANAAETPFTQAAVPYYDGSSISASVTDAAVFDMVGAFSLEMWMNPSSVQSGFWTPFGKNNQYWFEGGGSGQLSLTFNVNHSGSTTGSGGTPTMVAGQLNHIVGTFTPSGVVAIYLNGSLKSSSVAPASADTNANPVMIGNRQGFSRFFAGQIADARIWNGALSANDIAAHYADPGNLYVASATLVGRWKGDEGAGTTLNDSSGNSNNATLSGASWNLPFAPYLVQPLLATGATHTVDDVITALQKIGLVRQS